MFNKYIILTVILLCSFYCNGQIKSDSTIKIFHLNELDIGRTYRDTSVIVTVWQDGRFEIQGDSLKAIKLLWKRLEESTQREMDLYKSIQSAVDFTNNVPDYWKNNSKEWIKYQVQLKKLGYKIIKK